MEIVQRARLKTDQRKGARHDAAIMLGYVTFAVVFMIAIYFGSLSPGTAPGDLARMTVFP
ncbi:hypothetical protein UP10_34410 [Bradyrhizobium sp. LTSPM299]|nr:hypothetical protein UP10_34410 [Bradyrhizobium sp. LTSPM299]